MANKIFSADEAQKLIERFKTSLSLNTPERQERFNRAVKAGYSMEFAAVFALQESK